MNLIEQKIVLPRTVQQVVKLGFALDLAAPWQCSVGKSYLGNSRPTPPYADTHDMLGLLETIPLK